MSAKRSRGGGKGHQFGGAWTTAKLDVLAKYLAAYLKVLKDKPSAANPFRKAFIDAFAGTGYREFSQREDGLAPKTIDLPFEQSDPAPLELLDGSARRALQIEPAFDKYIFVEMDPERCRHLEHLKQEFSHLASSIDVRQGDANKVIKELCSGRDWRAHRAVLFLDPYGTQVEWDTLKAVAATKAIDLWLLFPLGMGVNRMLTKSGEIPEAWRRRLDALFGTSSWYDDLYRVTTKTDLFGNVEEMVVKAKIEIIARYCNNRLKTIFAGVAEEPGVLRNATNSPLYLFCFAVGNARARGPALNIANDLLRDLR